ncbi:hypothetical protein LTR86_008924 [Recurvomyces mirabilis]|nr:hypothetical protein LTR86_008924 [Recurvomyces mirabilis]
MGNEAYASHLVSGLSSGMQGYDNSYRNEDITITEARRVDDQQQSQAVKIISFPMLSFAIPSVQQHFPPTRPSHFVETTAAEARRVPHPPSQPPTYRYNPSPNPSVSIHPPLDQKHEPARRASQEVERLERKRSYESVVAETSSHPSPALSALAALAASAPAACTVGSSARYVYTAQTVQHSTREWQNCMNKFAPSEA